MNSELIFNILLTSVAVGFVPVVILTGHRIISMVKARTEQKPARIVATVREG
jgi:hypothetical protein